MFLVFLPALNFRGDRAPYLWWFHKLLSSFGEEASYVCGAEYFCDPKHLSARGGLEFHSESARLHEYRVPDKKTLDRQVRVDIPLETWMTLEAKFPANPLAAFQHYCLVEDEHLCAAIETALDQVTTRVGPLEAVLTCVNCASLQRVCRQRNLQLLHLEIGPLRRPHFLPTAYFDFSGVNGRTESEHRYNDAKRDTLLQDCRFTIEQLRALLMAQRLESTPPSTDLGLALQIEDDSNLICYGQGFTTPTLINHARQQVMAERIAPPVLVRTHPGSFFSIRTLPRELAPDPSAHSPEFIMRCRRIDTINSGTAAEAALLGRSVRIYGDSPITFCLRTDLDEWDADALVFFFLNYLVPWGLAFQPEYLRWRLGHPTEQEIRQRHVEALMKERIRILESRITELEQAVAERDQQLAQIRSSLLWRSAFAVWKACRSILQGLGWYRKSR